MTEARRVFEEGLRHDGKNSRFSFGLAQTALYLGRAEEFLGHKDAAEYWRDTAIVDAQNAIGLSERSPDAHALLAELYGAKVSGMFSAMRYGPKADAETQRAFQLDPNNSRAFAVVGAQVLLFTKLPRRRSRQVN